MTKIALISGINGQDGSYLAEFLLEKGYDVFGVIRRTSTFNRGRIEHLHQNKKFKLIYGDLSDSSFINNIIRAILPDEVYNLAAQSHVMISFEIPEYTGDVNAIGTVRFLEAIRKTKEETGKTIKFYQASSSELYGDVAETPQKETTPFYPRSPYGCAKLYAFWITKNYRESYGLFACNGILFNHESPRRGENFVTRKITLEVAKIKEGITSCFSLGNLNAKRDWGHAKDYVVGMWLMLQQEEPDDYILATGETHSVREFLEESFKVAGIEIKSNGKSGIEEEYVEVNSNKPVVKIDPRYFRPAEVNLLLGDASKAKEKLKWAPKYFFKDLVKEMVESDINKLTTELYGPKRKN